MTNSEGPTCGCDKRPDWATITNDIPLMWPVLESGEWEELRQCPVCNHLWLATWPEELEGFAILCRPRPYGTTRLRDLNRAETLRAYMMERIAEHVGELKEEKKECIKKSCIRKRIKGNRYCIEHLIAQRFGRQLSRLGREESEDSL